MGDSCLLRGPVCFSAVFVRGKKNGAGRGRRRGHVEQTTDVKAGLERAGRTATGMGMGKARQGKAWHGTAGPGMNLGILDLQP